MSLTVTNNNHEIEEPNSLRAIIIHQTVFSWFLELHATGADNSKNCRPLPALRVSCVGWFVQHTWVVVSNNFCPKRTNVVKTLKQNKQQAKSNIPLASN